MNPIFCVIDTETTGTDTKKHGIIQLAGAILEIRDKQWYEHERFDIFCKPFKGQLVSKEALEINGRTLEEIRTFQEPLAAYQQFTDILGKYVNKYNPEQKMTLAGWWIRFDEDMVREWFLNASDKFFGSWFWTPSYEVSNLVYAHLLRERPTMPNFKLATVADKLGIHPNGDLHNAVADVDLTVQLLKSYAPSSWFV